MLLNIADEFMAYMIIYQWIHTYTEENTLNIMVEMSGLIWYQIKQKQIRQSMNNAYKYADILDTLTNFLGLFTWR